MSDAPSQPAETTQPSAAAPRPDKIRSILATDCGSTTTKAILIELTDEGYRLKVRGEAPTTVEAPFDDVTVGVINAVTEVAEVAGRTILDEDGRIIMPRQGDAGVDLYLSTSSAGGGLQMLVAGVVRTMTAESAERAALGAGAIVMDVLSSNDKRQPHEQITRIRHLRPDMILLSGGVDGGTTSHVAELAELIGAADPKPRLGSGYELPVVFAGNVQARDGTSPWPARPRWRPWTTCDRPSTRRTSTRPATRSTTCSWSTSWPRRRATTSSRAGPRRR